MKIIINNTFCYVFLTLICLSQVSITTSKQNAPVQEPKLLILKGAKKELANQCELVAQQVLKRLDKEIEIKNKLESVKNNPVKVVGPASTETKKIVDDIKANIELIKKESAEQLATLKTIFQEQLKECSKNKHLSASTKENIKKSRKMMRGI